MSADRSASVLARLLNRSRSTGENYNMLLSRFVIERLLFRRPCRRTPAASNDGARYDTPIMKIALIRHVRQARHGPSSINADRVGPGIRDRFRQCESMECIREQRATARSLSGRSRHHP